MQHTPSTPAPAITPTPVTPYDYQPQSPAVLSPAPAGASSFASRGSDWIEAGMEVQLRSGLTGRVIEVAAGMADVLSAAASCA
jgi:cell shape-determining protein MreC